jgi:uncharacterized protein
MKHFSFLLALLGFGWAALPTQAQNKYYTRKIPMRDGKVLAADFFSNDSTVAKPVLLIQTPYNRIFYRTNVGIPSTAGGLIPPYDSANYHMVTVDWRGFYGSTSAATAQPNYGEDGFDVVEWIAAQPWCNGKVGTWGISALARVQYWTMAEQPPHLVCAMPGAAEYINEYSDYMPGGVYLYETGQTQLQLGFSVNTATITGNPTENATWNFVKNQSDISSSIKIPLLVFTGWFDLDPQALLSRFYQDLKLRTDTSVRAKHKLIIGPWQHGQMDAAQQGEFNFPDAANVLYDAGLRFYNYYLRNQNNGYPNDPVFRYHDTNGQGWQSNLTDWNSNPQRVDLSLFLQPNGALGTAANQPMQQQLIYNPRDPSPTEGGARLLYFTSTASKGPVDISTVEARNDAAVFSTGALQQDFRVNGTLKARIYFRADQLDGDLHVRLTDVLPNGKSIILLMAARRLRYRRGTTQSILLTPNAVDSADIVFSDIAYTFQAGHQLRLVVSGSNYPYFDRNLNNGNTLYAAGDTNTITFQLLGGPNYPSRLIVESLTPVVTAREEVLESKSEKILVWPNPSSGAIYLSGSFEADYQILSTDGRIVLNGEYKSNEVIDISSLSSGLYLLRLPKSYVRFVKSE